ncbi:MAG TPA: DapH/DapD/GlmU-related protein, partial [Ramlibacter sp.]
RPVIGSDVWIGANVVIRLGVRIGHGAILAANSVVVADVPAYTIVGGVPAKPIRRRFPAPVVRALLESRWWQYDMHDLSGISFDQVELALEQIAERVAGGMVPRPVEYVPYVPELDTPKG